MNGKHRSLDQLVTRLHADLGPGFFDIVDHWEADACATGLAAPANHQILVYVSTYPPESGLYNYECEVPPAQQGDIYDLAGRGWDVDYEQLHEVVRAHLVPPGNTQQAR